MAKSANPEFGRFLETYPLYRAFEVEPSWEPPKVSVPNNLRLVLECARCGGQRRTFAVFVFRRAEKTTEGIDLETDVVSLVYATCTHCQKEIYTFALLPTETKQTKGKVSAARSYVVQKVGQTPSARPRMPPALRSLLDDENRGLFVKGLTAESYSFGIGAFVYYRRVVENTIDRLLTELANFDASEGGNELRAAVEAVRGAKRGSEKIDAVKDLVPASLRPGGFNPLGKLYEILSDGIHGRSDEDCLTTAEALREVLVGLVVSMAQQKTAHASYADAAAKLLALGAKARAAGEAEESEE